MDTDSYDQKLHKTTHGVQLVSPGEILTTESGFLRGHGTYTQDTKLIASVCGVVERVNKLISVKPLKARYKAEVGDVVVGRVVEVGQSLWKVDINGTRHATLALSATNLPFGELRKRTAEDRLQMRSIFVEQDLISAEVHSVQDSGIALHTRSLMYGKLVNGQLVIVPSTLVKRVKNHFYTFPYGIGAILGKNGYIWISNSVTEAAVQGTTPAHEMLAPPLREKIARTRNAIVALSDLWMTISPTSIERVYYKSLEEHVQVKDMVAPEFLNLVKTYMEQNESEPTKMDQDEYWDAT